jgi:hypothetical protein
MTREASVATLRRLAEAYSEDQRWNSVRSREALREAWMAYRSESCQLRTREEVDADKLNLATMLADGGCDMKYFRERWPELAREPTRDSGPSSADAEEVPSPRPPASPAGADLSTVLTEIRALVAWPAPISSVLRERIRGLCDSYGPPGAVAAKESTDNAAAPEGAALEDVEPCGCEETEALKRKLSDIRTEWLLCLDGKKSTAGALDAIGLILREP